jgi:DGQHR domain-containing protein
VICNKTKKVVYLKRDVQMKNRKFKSDCIHLLLGEIPAFTFTMKVKDLLYIYYIAVRGRDIEEGAVQRPLNSQRVEKIKDYVLEGNTFFNSFILNWTENKELVKTDKSTIEFPIISASAQAIDGQHRLAGLERAIEEVSEIEDQKVIVTLTVGLETKDAAQIFLNINTEQKPVPKSLLFDLFGEVVGDPEHVVNRATDIARHMNNEDGSALYNLIKFPGAPRGVGRIELSTFVSALKPLLEKDSVFSRTKLRTFEHQSKVIFNFFNAIKAAYSEAQQWEVVSQNPFFKAAGFNGAIDFLGESLVLECAKEGSFTERTMKNIMKLERRELLIWDDLKGQDGKTARKNVANYLENGLISSLVEDAEYKF